MRIANFKGGVTGRFSWMSRYIALFCPGTFTIDGKNAQEPERERLPSPSILFLASHGFVDAPYLN